MGSNTDGYSRLMLPVSFQEIPIPGETIPMMQYLVTMPVSAKQARLWTQPDPILSKVLQFILRGWP